MTNIAHETIKAARKTHQCDWCGEKIIVGQPYVRQRIKDCTDVWTWRAHPECDRASGTLSKMDLECSAGNVYTRGCICERGDKWCDHKVGRQ